MELSKEIFIFPNTLYGVIKAKFALGIVSLNDHEPECKDMQFSIYTKAVVQRCSVKKVFLEISHKVAGLRPEAKKLSRLVLKSRKWVLLALRLTE